MKNAKKPSPKKIFIYIVSWQANISDTPFDQRSLRPPEVGVLNCHRQTHRLTDRHGASMNESAQWAKSVKILTECLEEGASASAST